MKLRISNREYKRVAAICLVSLSIGLAAGFGAKGGENAEEAMPVGSIGEICILPDTSVRIELHYALCDHTEQRELEKTEWIGKTKREIAALNPGDSIAVFSREEVCLVRVIEGSCPAHLHLGVHENGQLLVYRKNADTLENETVLLLPTTVERLDRSVQESLEKGLLFNTMDEINAYLESAES